MGNMKMRVGYFIDKNREPSPEEIENALGELKPLWDDLIQSIRTGYSPEEDFKFLYGKNYGWGRRFRTKGKLLAVLYPAGAGFVVQLIMSESAIDTILTMGFGSNVRQAIDNATPYTEGRWLFIPVEDAEDLSDIKRLLVIKMKKK